MRTGDWGPVHWRLGSRDRAVSPGAGSTRSGTHFNRQGAPHFESLNAICREVPQR